MKNVNKMIGATSIGMLGCKQLLAEQFPWWYTKVLGWHLPPWLITTLEQMASISLAEVIIASASLFIGITLFCAFRAWWKKRKELALLRTQHTRLQKQHEALHFVEQQQQLMISHLTTLIAHQAALQNSKEPKNFPTPPEPPHIPEEQYPQPLSDASSASKKS